MQRKAKHTWHGLILRRDRGAALACNSLRQETIKDPPHTHTGCAKWHDGELCNTQADTHVVPHAQAVQAVCKQPAGWWSEAAVEKAARVPYMLQKKESGGHSVKQSCRRP
jgi:hypothetical protein